MMVSTVHDSQSHLSSRLTAYQGSSHAMRGVERSRTGAQANPSSQVNKGWGKTEQVKSFASTSARQVRTMNTQVQAITEHIQQATGDIRTFRKNFPPFPRGSEERERLLNSFQGIRKQMERLSFPPKKDTVPALEGDAVSPSGSVNRLVEGFETLLQTIGAYIPDVPDDTSDSAFQALAEKLETLLEFIFQQRAELVEPGKYYEESGDTEAAVEMVSFSITLGRTFSDRTDWQMSVSQTRFKGLQA